GRESVFLAVRGLLLALVRRALLGVTGRSGEDQRQGVALRAHQVVRNAVLEGDGELRAGRLVRDVQAREPCVLLRERRGRLERFAARRHDREAGRLGGAFDRADRAVHLDLDDGRVRSDGTVRERRRLAGLAARRLGLVRV